MKEARATPIGRGRPVRDDAASFNPASIHREQILHGRGATFSPAARYDKLAATPFDDGWNDADDDAADRTCDVPYLASPRMPCTELTQENARKIITYNNSPDIGFDRSINPYRGCEHGCVYCFARPSHAWLGLSPGLDFETKITFKPDAASLLEQEFAARSYMPKPIGLGTNTDPWQPVERRLAITRSVLEVMERYSHPVTIVTKSAGILRDLDILAAMAQRSLVQVRISLTTLDADLCRRMEPRASSTTRRLEAIRVLSNAGVPVGALVAPMIPGLTDTELEALCEAAAKAGARDAAYILLRLPLEVAPIFENWLERHYPDRARKVMGLIRSTRGGGLYDSRYGWRFSGSGPYAMMLAQRHVLISRKLGFAPLPKLDCARFTPPAPVTAGQLSLF